MKQKIRGGGNLNLQNYLHMKHNITTPTVETVTFHLYIDYEIVVCLTCWRILNCY